MNTLSKILIVSMLRNKMATRSGVVRNGSVIRRGSGSAVLGHPLNALQWLVNALASHGLGLKAGQYVTTGVTSEIYLAEPGDRITADFGPVGTAELVFG